MKPVSTDQRSDRTKYIRCRVHKVLWGVGFTLEGPWQARSIVSGEIFGWWMLDLARATDSDNYCIMQSKTTAGRTLPNLVLQ